MKLRQMMLLVLAGVLLTVCGCQVEELQTDLPEKETRSAVSPADTVPPEEKKPTVPENIPEDMTYLYDFSFSERYDAKVDDAFSLTWPDGTVRSLYEQYKTQADGLELSFDGEGMTAYDYKRYWYSEGSDRGMVGTHHYELDELEYITYLWSDAAGVKTARGAAVGTSEAELVALYPEDLYYVQQSEAFSEAVLGVYELTEVGREEATMGLKEAFDFEFAYCWQPFENNDIRDITFYMRDGAVCAIEIAAPFELRHVYGFDREAALRHTEEVRNGE